MLGILEDFDYLLGQPRSDHSNNGGMQQSQSSNEGFPLIPQGVKIVKYIYGLVQVRRNSIANVLDLRLSCTRNQTWSNNLNKVVDRSASNVTP